MSENKNNIIEASSFDGVLSSRLKNSAQIVLESIDFPTTKTEAWKYTRVGKIANKQFCIQPKEIDSIENYIISTESQKIVFINGFYSEKFSNKEFDKIEVIPLSKIEKGSISSQSISLENEIFNSLNTIYATDGILIKIKEKQEIKEVIEIIHIATGDNTISSVRNFIQAEKSSNATIIQSFFSENASETFSNIVTEIEVNENAYLTIDKIQLEDENCFHISTEQVNQDKNSNFTINTITLNGGLVRNNLNINVNAQNCETHLNGIYVLKGKQHVDNHTTVDHKVPNCNSFESYKGVMYDQSTAVFNGKVFVRKDAQKTNAFQQNANVLVSPDATVNSKPELEIYADDVKCSHGSTIGQLDEEAIFYLRARGISEKSARQLVVSAFISETVDKIKNKDVIKFIHEKLDSTFEL